MIHLDTSFLILALVAGSEENRRLRHWLGTGERLAASATVWAEFLCGPLAPGQIELAARILPERVPFTDREAQLAARLFNQSGRRRGSFLDCMIAATAISHDAALATDNVTDFRRFTAAGLKMAPD